MLPTDQLRFRVTPLSSDTDVVSASLVFSQSLAVDTQWSPLTRAAIMAHTKTRLVRDLWDSVYPYHDLVEPLHQLRTKVDQALCEAGRYSVCDLTAQRELHEAFNTIIARLSTPLMPALDESSTLPGKTTPKP